MLAFALFWSAAQMDLRTDGRRQGNSRRNGRRPGAFGFRRFFAWLHFKRTDFLRDPVFGIGDGLADFGFREFHFADVEIAQRLQFIDGLSSRLDKFVPASAPWFQRPDSH